MSELEKPATSGAAPSTSGDGVGATDPKSTSGDSKSYNADFVEKLKKEKHNTASALKEALDKIKEYEDKDSQDAEKKLLEEKQFKTVIDTYKRENDDLKSKIKVKDELETRAKKNSAIMKELVKIGFSETETNKGAAVRLFDLTGVEVDPTTNVVVGAEDAAKRFHEKFATLGFFTKKPAPANHEAPKVNLSQGQVDISNMKKEDKYNLLAELANKR